MTPILPGTASRLGLRKPHLRIEAAIDRCLVEVSRGDSQLRRLLFESKAASAEWHREMEARVEAVRANVDRRAGLLLPMYERAFEAMKHL